MSGDYLPEPGVINNPIEVADMIRILKVFCPVISVEAEQLSFCLWMPPKWES
jgi:hypothetical protein